jgi:hypothetical protein
LLSFCDKLQCRLMLVKLQDEEQVNLEQHRSPGGRVVEDSTT